MGKTVNIKAASDKKVKKKAKVENNIVMKCSRNHVEAALRLVKEKIQTHKERSQMSKIQKCKQHVFPGTACFTDTRCMPCSETHKIVHLRNALISHNWKDATFLLLNMLKSPRNQLIYKNIWRAFFLILQHSPQSDYTRMEHFRQLCQQREKGGFLKAISF